MATKGFEPRPLLKRIGASSRLKAKEVLLEITSKGDILPVGKGEEFIYLYQRNLSIVYSLELLQVVYLSVSQATELY